MSGKTKKFRVAVSGPTVDGRTITPEMLKTAASSYNFKNRAARINLSHIKGYSAEPPFNCYGDVLSAETREEEMIFNGKKEKVTALYVEMAPNEQLLELNKKGQALYTSIELLPNYRGQEGVWSLTGLAITDIPASFGTDRLEFSLLPVKIDGLEFSDALKLEFENTENDVSMAQTIAAEIVKGFSSIFKPAVNQDAAVAAAAEKPAEEANQEFDAAALGALFTQSLAKIEESFKTQIGELKTSFETQKSEIATLKEQIDNTPNNFTNRSKSTGSTSAYKAEC